MTRVHRPRGTCTTCGRDCPLIKAGTVQAHNPPWSPWPCDGEGQAPKEAT